jgi:hypothetical protein
MSDLIMQKGGKWGGRGGAEGLMKKMKNFNYKLE